MVKKYVILFVLLGIFGSMHAQEIYRIKGDFTVKAKGDSASSLTIGKFYYDKTQKKIVYNISFPKPEVWIFDDTLVYRFQKDSLIDVSSGISLNEFSIFHLSLNNELSNYGLKNSVYSLTDVEISKGLVISTWSPPKAASHLLGEVIMSTKNKELQGIVFLDKDGKPMRKQMFKEYINFNGLSFPTLIQDTFLSEKFKSYQITSYKNIKLNESDNYKFYNFHIPKQFSYLLSK